MRDAPIAKARTNVLLHSAKQRQRLALAEMLPMFRLAGRGKTRKMIKTRRKIAADSWQFKKKHYLCTRNEAREDKQVL